MDRERAVWLQETRAKGAGRRAEAIVQELSDEEPVADAAARVPARSGEPALAALCAALQHPNRSVRGCAAKWLGRIGDRRSVEPLCEALRRGQIDAAAALGEIALREPVAELLAAVPLLQQRAEAQRFFDSSATQRTLRTALERIEATLAPVRRLPIPAAPPLPTAGALPIPAGPPAPLIDRLPVPACAAGAPDPVREPGDASRPARPTSRMEVRSWQAGSEAARRWWQCIKPRLCRSPPRPGPGP